MPSPTTIFDNLEILVIIPMIPNIRRDHVLRDGLEWNSLYTHDTVCVCVCVLGGGGWGGGGGEWWAVVGGAKGMTLAAHDGNPSVETAAWKVKRWPCNLVRQTPKHKIMGSSPAVATWLINKRPRGLDTMLEPKTQYTRMFWKVLNRICYLRY